MCERCGKSVCRQRGSEDEFDRVLEAHVDPLIGGYNRHCGWESYRFKSSITKLIILAKRLEKGMRVPTT
jgi:hypothetical protein